MLNRALLDALDPIYRLEFEKRPLRSWQITWPDGSTEVIEGHSMQLMGEHHDAASFGYHYIGSHRIINLSHVRDIAEVT